MADGDVPLLRSRDYLPKGSGCDSNLRQLIRSLEDLRSNHRACLRAVTELRRDVRELRELLQQVAADAQEKAGAPSGETPRAPSQIQGEPRQLRSTPETVADTRSVRNESEEQRGPPSPCQ